MVLILHGCVKETGFFFGNIWNLKFLAVYVNKCLYQIKFTPNVRTAFWATILYLVPWVKLNFGSNIKIWRDFQFMQKARTTGVGYWILFRSMVPILDGNSLIGAHVVIRPVQGIWLHREQSQIGYFCPNRIFFFHACATCFELASIKSTTISQGFKREDKPFINPALAFSLHILCVGKFKWRIILFYIFTGKNLLFFKFHCSFTVKCPYQLEHGQCP